MPDGNNVLLTIHKSLVKEVSLQGRKMVGQYHTLYSDYQGIHFQIQLNVGLILGKLNTQTGYLFDHETGTERIDFDVLAKFNQLTEWKKDQWLSGEKCYVGNVMDYLECSKILHGEDMESMPLEGM